MELLENGVKLVLRDTNAGIPDFDAQNAPVTTAAEQDFTTLRIFDGIGHHIADHLREKHRVAVYQGGAAEDVEREISALRKISELIPQMIEQVADREGHRFGDHHA